MTEGQVERAQGQERRLVRTWLMRGTLHLVAAEDIGWLLALFGPVFLAANRTRRAQLGLDEAVCQTGLRALHRILAESGPLTRAELVARLTEYDLHLEGQAVPHLLGYAALSGLICEGAPRGAKPTYVLLEDWVGPDTVQARPGADSELARRYLAAYAPAGPEDFAAWSGLSAGRARAAWRELTAELVVVRGADRELWLLADQAAWLDQMDHALPSVRLAPAFDTYLLGYRDRSLALAPEFARRVHPGGGILRPALLVDGQVQGAWQAQRQRGKVVITVDPFQALSDAVYEALETEVAQLSRFYGVAATLNLV